MAKILLHTVLSILFPQTCVSCSRRLISKEKLRILCSQCTPQVTKNPQRVFFDEEEPAAKYCVSCRKEIEETLRSGLLCFHCLLYPAPFQRLRSLWYYRNTPGKLVKLLKYANKKVLAAYFAELLAECLGDETFWDGATHWDLLVPLPSPFEKAQQKGFSHTVTIVRKLSPLVHIPYSTEALLARPRLPQVELSKKERINNVAHSFVAIKEVVRNKKILLIDDVVTTGASLYFATKCLLQNQATQVDCLTITQIENFNYRDVYRICKNQRRSTLPRFSGSSG